MTRRVVAAAAFALAVAAGATDAGGGTLPPTAAAERIDRYLAGRASAGTFSGAVLVATGNRIIFERAYGSANYEDGTPNATTTLFRIASMTKPLVAAAALVLASRGRLDLDASICASVRPCPLGWQPVTLRNLLTFTSGIPDLFSSVAAVPPSQLPDAVNAAISSTKKETLSLTAPPGTRTEYSNFDYLLLAYAIQRSSRQSWLEAVTDLILTPAGMTSTRYDDALELVRGRARGYIIAGTRIENTKYEDDGGLSAGGMLSTLGDLYRFVAAYQDARFFPAPMRDLALRADDAGFGYGWQIASFFGRPIQDFTGGTNGFSSNMSYYPQDATTVIVLSNLENAGAKGVSCDIGAIVHGDAPRNELLSFAPVTAAASDIIGTFAGKDGTLRTFALGTNGLTYHGSRSSLQSVIRNGTRSYALADRPDVVFDVAADGKTVRASSCGSPLFEAARVR